MRKQVLTIEQMQTLKDKGFDISNASVGSRFCDGIYHKYFKDDYIGEDVGNDMDFMTLQDILEELPESIDGMKFTIEKKDNIWHIGYYIQKEVCIYFGGSDLLTEANNLLNWCIDNGHVKTSK